MPVTVPAVLMRGGTSKCWVFDESDLDALGADRDGLLLRLFGSPDVRQIDGVGGATSTTSKAVLLRRSQEPGVDVDYTFAQIGITGEGVDWSNNCGNCSTTVGLYAVQQGWVRPTGETTRVAILNTNTGKRILQDVPTPDGEPTNRGEVHISGVPFPAPGIRMGFVRPQGAVSGTLLPSGRPVDTLDTPRGPVRASLVDAGNPGAVLWGPDLGLDGTEPPEQVDGDPGLLETLEAARAHASELMGIAPSRDKAAETSRAIPKLVWIAPAAEQRTLSGETLAVEEMDLAVRMLSMGTTHPALAITVCVCIAAGSSVPDSVIPAPGSADGPLRLATPSGVVPVWIERDAAGEVEAAFLMRNARRLATARLDVDL
jgi:2-methylaconitate isomerase